ncbi:MAG TPA: TadE family protein [Candidatus Saccharimonadales bacterium]|nr:TadE family protein [Candidatus Saccharimonadales bacterium]
MARSWGQALVEFALILPIFLMLMLGGLQVGLALMVRYELVHAAIDGADAGARDIDPLTRCDTALAVLASDYGRVPDNDSCTAGSSIEVTAAVDLPLLVPLGPGVWRIAVDERAALP